MATLTDSTIDSTNQTYIIKEKLASLEAALLESTPNMPSLLKDIHTIIKKDPDVVTLLSEEDCVLIVNGLKKQTNTEIATSAMKTKGTKALKQLTISDL